MNGRGARLATAAHLIPVVFLAAAAWQRRWVSDDGFIVLRVVRMATEGHGPVFNAGERVEAATSPLWVAVLTVADALTPVRLEWLAVGLGIGAATAGLAAAIGGAARLWDDRARHAGGAAGATRIGAAAPGTVPLGALVLAAYPPAWDYATAGLETGLVVAWIGLSILAMAGWARAPAGRVPAHVAVVVGLGPLLRPDLAVASALFVGALVIGDPGADLRSRLRVAAAAAAIPSVVQLARMGWYGALVPAPVLTKEGGRAWWSQGWRWVADGVGPSRLWFPVLVLGLLLAVQRAGPAAGPARRRVALVAGVFPLAGALWLTGIVRAGGDFMHGRLLVPALALCLAPVAAVPVPIRRGWRRRGVVGAVAVVAAWAVVAAAFARAPRPELARAVNDVRAFSVALSGHRHPVTVDDWGAGPGGPREFRARSRVRLYDGTRPVLVGGRPLRPAPGVRSPVSVAYGVGLLAYAAGPGVRVFDGLGLGDPVTARFALQGRGRRPGHEKVSPPAWTWGRLVAEGEPLRPDAFPLPALLVADRAPTVAEPGDRRLTPAGVRAVRRALRCGWLAELQAAVTAPMTPARFLRNVGFALRSATRRIPPEPSAALRQACQTGRAVG